MTPPPSTKQAPSRRSREHGDSLRGARAPIGEGVRREIVRNRLIESRLTPNAISLTGFALNVVAAVLVWERLFFLGGIAFIVG
jgi:CDP-diacylglycerol---glycerol-3-phosphate 3-phosphatidyltransferase